MTCTSAALTALLARLSVTAWHRLLLPPRGSQGIPMGSVSVFCLCTLTRNGIRAWLIRQDSDSGTSESSRCPLRALSWTISSSVPNYDKRHRVRITCRLFRAVKWVDGPDCHDIALATKRITIRCARPPAHEVPPNISAHVQYFAAPATASMLVAAIRRVLRFLCKPTSIH